MDKVLAKSTALGYLVAVAASSALVSVGLFFLIRESKKKNRAERLKLFIIMGIVFATLGSVLLLGITILFVMSGLTQKMFLGQDEALIMAYLAGVVLATTILCVGVFMLIDQLEKNKERRELTKFVLSIVFVVLGGILLVAIGVVFLGKSGGGMLLPAAAVWGARSGGDDAGAKAGQQKTPGTVGQSGGGKSQCRGRRARR